MKSLGERLQSFKGSCDKGSVCVMILGLGSVGAYLLDYLVSSDDPAVKVVVAGRSYEKMEEKVNIIRIGALIRERNKSQVIIEGGVDLNDTDCITGVIKKHEPDIIVNSSRAYPGLKYGSISWANLRAYGIWSPLAIRFTKNIMQACDIADTNAIVINTSYSDAVIPWLKSAGRAFPDFGSGNLNHLIPRMRYAAAKMTGKDDYWNFEIMFACGHFHDVCISKEGQTEGVKLPLRVYYRGEEVNIDDAVLFSLCSIPMPVDSTRNMMNASSNYRIIRALMDTALTGRSERIFSPGALGQLGGYPVKICMQDEKLTAEIDDSVFSMDDMAAANAASMALDGIEKIEDGTLYYTDELIGKTDRAFGVSLPKSVAFEQIEDLAALLINEIIIPQTEGKNAGR